MIPPDPHLGGIKPNGTGYDSQKPIGRRVSAKKNPETRCGDSTPCVKHVKFVLLACGFCCYVLNVFVHSTAFLFVGPPIPSIRFHQQCSSRITADSQNTQRILATFDAGNWVWRRDQPESEKQKIGYLKIKNLTL